jgi:hypothetical protein
MAPKFSKHSFSEETLSVRLRNWHTKFSLSSGRSRWSGLQACKFLFGNSFWLVFSCPRSTASLKVSSSRVVGYRRSPVHYLFGPMYCSLHPGTLRNETTLGLKFIQSLIQTEPGLYGISISTGSVFTVAVSDLKRELRRRGPILNFELGGHFSSFPAPNSLIWFLHSLPCLITLNLIVTLHF